jgi:Dyp-type peroxidase family
MEQLELDDIQGIVPYAYLRRTYASYVMLTVQPERAAGARRWLGELLPHVGRARAGRAKPMSEPVISLAFTYAGLEALGVSAADGFVPEFHQGMVHPHRSRVLGDIDVDQPGYRAQNAPAHWRWGKTNDSVHILLAVYAAEQRQLTDFVARHIDWKVVTVVYRRDAAFKSHKDDPRDLREPFGFRDGISQPYVEGFGRPAPLADAPVNRVRAGEFVLGYQNELARTGQSPSVSAESDRNNLLPTLPDGRKDLGRNGSYLVVRELDQDVPAFRALHPVEQAKLIGRWPSGAPLTLAPHADDPSLSVRNDFAYFTEDRAGMSCPVGAHVRRANPRDGFADPDLPLTAAESHASVNQHRLLRRGRPYESELHQGTFFMCLNSSIERQFEFVQQAWLNAPSFLGLNGERDFAAGAATPFTIPHCSGRERLTLPALIQVRGGAYFFLPGHKALKWITEPERR